jgi:hypothetical protein
MLSGEIAKYQIKDRVHAAEKDRAAASIRVDRDRGPTVMVRRVGSGLLAAVVGRRKASPTSATIGVAR